MAKADSSNVLTELKAHLKKGAPDDMRRAFERDPKRFTEFSAQRGRPAARLFQMRRERAHHEAAVAAREGSGRRGQARRHVQGRHHQQHGAARRSPHRTPQPRQHACDGGGPRRDAGRQRRARRHVRLREAGAPLEDHRRRQHRHRRLRPRPRHDHAGAGALSRRPAPPLRLQRRRRAHRRHAEDPEARDDAVPHRVQDLHHHRDHDQREDRADLDRRMRWARRRWASISPPSPPPSTR